jgi:hypothetical protein
MILFPEMPKRIPTQLLLPTLRLLLRLLVMLITPLLRLRRLPPKLPLMPLPMQLTSKLTQQLPRRMLKPLPKRRLRPLKRRLPPKPKRMPRTKNLSMNGKLPKRSSRRTRRSFQGESCSIEMESQ